MDNIFEGAKFGDKFKTREDSEAVFIKEEKQGNKSWYKCIIIDIHNDEYVEYYHQDGRINYSSGEEDLDIVSRYQESIDVETDKWVNIASKEAEERARLEVMNKHLQWKLERKKNIDIIDEEKLEIIADNESKKLQVLTHFNDLELIKIVYKAGYRKAKEE